MQSITDFIAIPIVGVALSLSIEWIKAKWATSPNTTKFVTLGLALVVAGAYSFLIHTSYWPVIVGVLGTASAFYAFFLK